MKNYWVAEYSKSQRKFHKDRLDVSVHKNVRSVIENTVNDWLIIGIFETFEEAGQFIAEVQKQMNLDETE